MFDVRKKIALIAIPGAALLIAGGAFTSIAASAPQHLHVLPAAAVTQTGGPSSAAEPPETAGEATTPDPDGPGGPDVQQTGDVQQNG